MISIDFFPGNIITIDAKRRVFVRIKSDIAPVASEEWEEDVAVEALY